MKTLTLSSMFMFMLFAATGNAQAQKTCFNPHGPGRPPVAYFPHRPRYYFIEPSRQAINWATAEQIRAVACQQRAIAEQEWVEANRSRWQFNLEKRDRSIQQPCLDEKTSVEAKTELSRAIILHRNEMLEKKKEMREIRKQEQAHRDQIRKADTAYVLDKLNGGVCWPEILASDGRFAAERETIDGMFRGKSRYLVELSTQECQKIAAAAKAMDQTLKEMVAKVSPQTYCEAHGFLMDLPEQAKFLIPAASMQTAAAKTPDEKVFASQIPVREICN